MKRSTPISLVAAILFTQANFSIAGDVSYIDVTSDGGIHINEGIVRVNATNGSFTQVTQPTVPFYVKMKAGCSGNKVVNYAFVSYGVEKVAGNIMESSDNFRVGVAAQLQKDLPYTPVVLNVPINKLGINPAAMCQSLLEKKLSQGVTRHQFFTGEHTINHPGGISAVAQCSRLGKSNGDFGLDVIGTPVKVICAAGSGGGPNQVMQPKLPIVAVPLGGNNAVQAGEGLNPLTISQAQIWASQLHYNGQCPATMNFTVNMQGSGKGQVRYHIVEGGQNALISPVLSFDGKNGAKQHHFMFPIEKKPAELNKLVNRSFSLYIELKDEKATKFDWSSKGNYSTLKWTQTCVGLAGMPTANQFNAQPPGGTSQPANKFNPQGPGGMPKPALPINAQPLGGMPKPPLQLNAQPVVETPKPATRLNVQTPVTPPKPELGIRR